MSLPQAKTPVPLGNRGSGGRVPLMWTGTTTKVWPRTRAQEGALAAVVMDGVVVFLFAGGGVWGGGGFGGVGGGVLFVQNFAQEEKKIGLVLLLLTEGTDFVAKGSEFVGVFGLRHGRVRLCSSGVPRSPGRVLPFISRVFGDPTSSEVEATVPFYFFRQTF